MSDPLRDGPWANAVLQQGIYDATVVEVIESNYGPEDDVLLKLIFNISPKGTRLVNHIYFPQGASIHSEQRLWHFCRCVALEKHHVISQPDAFAGRKLRLDVHTVHPGQSGQARFRSYSDVKAFLPAGTGQAIHKMNSSSDPFVFYPCDL